MYSREERMRAIELYIKYDKCAADVRRELGYPDRKSLRSWYKDYLEEQRTGVLWDGNSRLSRYTPEQKRAAVDHYLEHGRNFSRTVRMLGYPSRDVLRTWCHELAPGTEVQLSRGKVGLEEKTVAVAALCTRTVPAKGVAKQYGVTREALYNWKKELLGEGATMAMSKRDTTPLPDEKDVLAAEIDRMKSEIKQLKMEVDIWRTAAEIVKKGPGVDLRNLTNKEKATPKARRPRHGKAPLPKKTPS